MFGVEGKRMEDGQWAVGWPDKEAEERVELQAEGPARAVEHGGVRHRRTRKMGEEGRPETKTPLGSWNG